MVHRTQVSYINLAELRQSYCLNARPLALNSRHKTGRGCEKKYGGTPNEAFPQHHTICAFASSARVRAMWRSLVLAGMVGIGGRAACAAFVEVRRLRLRF